jgi:uncharacterized membrane protein HdeD (DUF308 family)
MVTNALLMDLGRIRHRWGWFLLLGIVMVVLGIAALFLTPVATVAAVLVLGWLMAAGGIIEILHAFRVRGWGGMFMHLILGVVGVAVGLLVATHPLAGALAYTLLFASFFIVIGLFRIIAAASLRFLNWGWALFDGIVTLALGILIWAEWPWSGYWFLGLALGITFLVRGWSYVMLSIAVRSLPVVAPERLRAA